jgi:hypothetical protein
VLAGIGFYLYCDVASERELQAAYAETDRLDPRWRLEDIEADRAVVPGATNSATQVMKAKRLLPKQWPYWDFAWMPSNRQEGANSELKQQFQEFVDSLTFLDAQRQFNEEQLTALRDELLRAEAALTEARRLADMGEGRYPVTYSPDFVSTRMPNAQDARQIASLLAYDVALRAQDKDTDGAVSSCRAIFNTVRSLGDDPLLISLLVRVGLRGVAVSRVQRVLAQGEPSDKALVALQTLIENEERQQLFLTAARGERAGQDHLMEAIQTGKITMSIQQVAELGGLGLDAKNGPTPYETLVWSSNSSKRAQRTAMLRWMNRYVEIAKLPPEKRGAELQQLEATNKDQPVMVRLLVRTLSLFANAAQRSDAAIRCALLAVAAERYRRAQSRWPATLEALKAGGYLQTIPTDPYDGQPLRWRRFDGVTVVYSVGPSGRYDGGKLENPDDLPSLDVEFRLWDVAKRRQPPVPFPLDAKLTAILAGKKTPGDAAERLAVAQFCRQRFKKLYAAACRHYAEAFAHDGDLADDMDQQYRYNAAGAAALAGCGQGNDADKPDDQGRARLRRQAVEWLRADLAYWTKEVDSHRALVQQTLQHWQDDADLAGIRDKDALMKLPADEREACQKLWADVAELLKR